MKKLILFNFTALLLALTFLTACGNPTTGEASEKPSASEKTTADAVSDHVSEAVEPDGFEKVRESRERWLAYGLSAYESGKTPADLKDFFADPENLSYLTLFDDMFALKAEAEKSIPVAEALFRFICEEYGKEALTDAEKRIEYKNAYLQSLGLAPTYLQPAEVERFLSSMEVSTAENENYKYAIAFDGVTYHFKNFQSGSPRAYHAFLYYNTTGLEKLLQYLKDNRLDDGLDTARTFDYYLAFDELTYSVTKFASGNMYLNTTGAALHEALHAMGITQKDHIWLSEGICSYIGEALGFNDQLAAADLQILAMAGQGYFDERAEAGDEVAILYKTAHDRYTAAGGKLDSLEAFDLQLFIDVSVKIELEKGKYATLGEMYEVANGKECTAVGSELSYEQAKSMIAYLVDSSGIDRVMEAYRTQDIEAIFGKPYDSLKADWLQYLG